MAIATPAAMDVGPSDRPLRIAVVYGRSPLPMRRADQLTVAHLLTFLKARGHAVDLFAINSGGTPDEADVAWLNQTCRKVQMFAHDRVNIAKGLARVPLSGLPFQVGLFTHDGQRAALEKAVDAGEYDIVYTYYFRSAEITRAIAKKRTGVRPRTFLAMQLSQTLNTRRIAENAPNWAYKQFYSLESRLVARYEAEIFRDFDRAVLIGKSDVAEINGTCERLGRPPIDNVVLCAHGVDVTRFRPRDDLPVVPGKLVFSGVMRTPTNVQAVQWFVTNVWPLIRAEVPDATFDIAGREPSSDVLALGKVPGVTVLGTVPDTSVPIAQAAICINSMQAGGGMQNKLIEYLGSGKPVVATSVANEGIGATDGEHLIVADEPADFAREVVALLRDPARSAQLGQAARRYIVENWTWEAHFLKLEQAFYQSLDEGA
ncbi:glycosyltransferase family 4 protein [Novosphingobium sp.]|uniref:glycosyltransferase family 4 protein n=1 Tax=Novosphingobium sp. TaxID=1874826 RepID=UPI0038B710AA